MLVGNKVDMESSRKTPREMGEQFAQEEGLLFTEASAKSGTGVEELFLEIGALVPLHSPSSLCPSHSLSRVKGHAEGICKTEAGERGTTADIHICSTQTAPRSTSPAGQAE